MADLDEKKIAEIVSRVIDRVLPQVSRGTPAKEPYCAPAPPVYTPRGSAPAIRTGSLPPGVFDDMDRAIDAAHVAFAQHERGSLETRARVVEAMRACGRRENDYLARAAVEETGLGRYDHKLKKNSLVIEKTPGIEILRPVALTGDHGLMLTERAPYGVIGAITPTTNPTETIICNAIGMVAGGNSVVFNVHPGAKGVSNYLVGKLNEAIVSAGGPPNPVCSMSDPTTDTAQAPTETK